MRLLLDTHTFIWFVMGDPRIPPDLQDIIADENNQKLLSKASVWEVAIKQRIGKLNFARPFRDVIEQQLAANGIDLLDISLAHIEVVASLPRHHRDPFDRLIIAQGIVENIPIISADTIFDAYPIQRIC
ncbi:type II toxin-antitoxin system VapC family toxin [Laspinema olomoucense]|uniref:Type II toxin-antitoxin system VapC family toxin n=1 Tax=Laspinema olomoucense D3b TaxID=2953688 RepID=A0ABT2NB44_9CYAN|nr:MULTISPECIES: type II toxin-antitoxin system VapC family toxin [unclassified Laspinema]MCT7979902.1 type II toxin-antitoxin system VapC family toxin [Laspinema sp. D3b]MCT7994479.1 type II toxin-antitoxin system VapC family toxin [Laspinema sp. D3c]